MKILILGDLISGFEFVGPFESEEEINDLLGDCDESLWIVDLMSKEEWQEQE